MSEEALRSAQAKARPMTRRRFELAAIAPNCSHNRGTIDSIEIAKTLIGNAANRPTGQDSGRLLEAAGFAVTTTDTDGGMTWLRRTKEGVEEVVVSEGRVYATIKRRGLGTSPRLVFDQSLFRKVGERGSDVCTVHHIWPDFMGDIGALTAMALEAITLAPWTLSGTRQPGNRS